MLWGGEGPCEAGNKCAVTPVCSRNFFFFSLAILSCTGAGLKVDCMAVLCQERQGIEVPP